MIVKASGKALVKFPAVNAVYKDDKIYPGAGVHVGVAVALDDGLIVPVIRNADTTPLRVLAQNTKKPGEKGPRQEASAQRIQRRHVHSLQFRAV